MIEMIMLNYRVTNVQFANRSTAVMIDIYIAVLSFSLELLSIASFWRIKLYLVIYYSFICFYIYLLVYYLFIYLFTCFICVLISFFIFSMMIDYCHTSPWLRTPKPMPLLLCSILMNTCVLSLSPDTIIEILLWYVYLLMLQ